MADEVHDLLDRADQLVDELVERMRASGGHGEMTVYRSDADYHAAHPNATMPASWHRRIAKAPGWMRTLLADLRAAGVTASIRTR